MAPKPRPQTRQLYVNFELAAQSDQDPAAVTKTAIKRWNAWTLAVRNQCVDLFRNLQDARELSREAAADVDRSINEYNITKGYGVAKITSHNHHAVTLNFTRLQGTKTNVHIATVQLAFFLMRNSCSRQAIDLAQDAEEHEQRCLDIIAEQATAWLNTASPSIERSDHKVLFKTGYGIDMKQALEDEPRHDSALDFPNLPLTQEDNQGLWLKYATIGGGVEDVAVSLWYKVGRGDRVLQRVVRKDVNVNTQTWYSALDWHGNVRDVNTRQPMEAYIHCLLASRNVVSERSLFVPFRHSSVDLYARNYSIYTEFCQLDSVGHVLWMYQLVSQRLPEPFLWYIFLTLVEASLIMQKGAIEDDQALDDWVEIVHRDIKPSNIFLGAPSDNFLSLYPTPMLGDFGISICTGPEDPANPELFCLGWGTPGFTPPECQSFVDPERRERLDRFKLGAHTNVLQIGLTMAACLAANAEEEPSIDYASWDVDTPFFEPDTMPGQHYSATLRAYICRCTHYDPEQRVGLAELRRDIRRLFNGQESPEEGVRDLLMLHQGRATEGRRQANLLQAWTEEGEVLGPYVRNWLPDVGEVIRAS